MVLNQVIKLRKREQNFNLVIYTILISQQPT